MSDHRGGPGLAPKGRRSAVLAAAALAVSLTAACGSTVQQIGSPGSFAGAQGLGVDGGGPQLPDGGFGGAESTSASRAAEGPGGLTGGSSPGAVAGRGAEAGASGTSHGTDGGVGGSAAGGGPTAAGATGRGFDKNTILIGAGRADEDGSAAAVKALGIDVGESSVSYDEAARVIIDDINARGGIGGRELKVVWHTNDTSEALFSPGTAAQSACATWTEDNRVFAVTAPGLAFMDDLIACLHKRGTPMIHPGGIQGDDRSYQDFYDAYPLYYALGSMEAGRYDRIAMRRLVDRGFFQKWNTASGAPASGATTAPMKLGLVVKEGARGNRSLRSQTEQLAKYGIKVTSVFRSSGDVSSAASESQAAMLQFRSESITHIFGAGLFHLNYAEQQGYRPRYFFDHDSLNPVALTAPAAQLRGAMGESIVPATVTNEASYPGHPPAYQPCLAVLAKAGIHPKSNLDHWSMQQLCDSFYPLRDALAASGALSNDGLRAGFVALGSKPYSGVTWTSQFTATRRASAIGLRDASFDEKCACFVIPSTITYSQ